MYERSEYSERLKKIRHSSSRQVEEDGSVCLFNILENVVTFIWEW